MVSIIIPVYNNGLFLSRCLESVFKQTYENIQVVIYDDASTDKRTKDILKTLDIKNSNNTIVRFSIENRGVARARNEAILRYAHGEFILPLDPDDVIRPDMVQKFVEALQKDKNLSPVYCDIIHVVNGHRTPQIKPEWSFWQLLQGPFIVNTSMFRQEAWQKAGGYDHSLEGWEDYDLYLRMALQGYKGQRVPGFMFEYHHHPNSRSKGLDQQKLWKEILTKNGYGHLIERY